MRRKWITRRFGEVLAENERLTNKTFYKVEEMSRNGMTITVSEK